MISNFFADIAIVFFADIVRLNPPVLFVFIILLCFVAYFYFSGSWPKKGVDNNNQVNILDVSQHRITFAKIMNFMFGFFISVVYFLFWYSYYGNNGKIHPFIPFLFYIFLLVISFKRCKTNFAYGFSLGLLLSCIVIIIYMVMIGWAFGNMN